MSAPDGGRREAVIVTVFVLALTLPFIGRPFHLDDDIYVKGAEQILGAPLDPLGGTQWLLGEVMPTYHFTQHPPLVSYYMAGVALLTGGLGERALHLAFLVFPLAAALSMLWLARRFVGPALTTTLLLVSTPAFLVSSHGLMTDVPLLACALGAVAAFVRGVDARSRGWLAVAAVCVSLAAFVQYRGLLLVPLVASYAWLHGRGWRSAAVVSLPATLLTTAWCAWTWRSYGVAHPLDAGSWLELDGARMAGDAVAYVGFLGGATVFPALLLATAQTRLRSGAAWLALGILATLAVAGWTTGYGPWQRLLFAAILFTGLAGLAALWPLPRDRSTDPAERADDAFLLLMLAVPLASQVVLNLFASVRSLLLCLPFLILVLVRGLTRAWSSERVSWWLRGSVVATLACGLGLAVADFRYAAAARDVAERSARSAPGAWFTGEWGFRHYAERNGLRPVTSRGTGVAAGDRLVMPENPAPAWLHPDFQRRLGLEDTIESHDRLALKVMSFEAHAGFYSNFLGLLPFSASSAPLERARIFEVRDPDP